MAFPSIALSCATTGYAQEFSAWLIHKGWIHSVAGKVVTVDGSYAGFALDIVNTAIEHGWATSGDASNALAVFRAELHPDRKRE
jgi:hypothetical protein